MLVLLYQTQIMLIQLLAVSDFFPMKRLTRIGQIGNWVILLAVDTSKETEASSCTQRNCCRFLYGNSPAYLDLQITTQRIMLEALIVRHRSSALSWDSITSAVEASVPHLESLFGGNQSIRDSLSLRTMSKLFVLYSMQ